MTKTATATATATGTYEIDKSHSEVAFQVRHLLSKVRGRFADFDGKIVFDPERPGQSSVDVSIKAASIDTAEPNRDAHLRSGDFFDIDQFAALTFKSTSVAQKSDDRFDVTGNLTIHGVTKTVTLPATYPGSAKDPWGNDRVAFEAEITLNRKDFGLNWNAALETGGFLVGDDIKVQLQIQAK